ncbi:MAG: hypothetical protein KIS73_12655 [Enhydrobacter sp.]|nr:hypothetical protein [Enhydrobacter sp.]
MRANATGLNGVRRDLIALAEADSHLELMVGGQGERIDEIHRRRDLRDA